jgi:hypothetical protein
MDIFVVEIIKYKGRWVTKLREMGGKVGSAPACACHGMQLSIGSNQDISQKYKMGDISKGVANKL